MSGSEQSTQRDKVIESASASTAPQANSSNFAYWLCAGVLGVTTAIVLAIALLVYAAFATAYYESVPSDGALVLENELDDSDAYRDWEDSGMDEDAFGAFQILAATEEDAIPSARHPSPRRA